MLDTRAPCRGTQGGNWNPRHHLRGGIPERTTYSYTHKGRLIEKEVHWYLAETETLDVMLSHEHRGHLWLDWDALRVS